MNGWSSQFTTRAANPSPRRTRIVGPGIEPSIVSSSVSDLGQTTARAFPTVNFHALQSGGRRRTFPAGASVARIDGRWARSPTLPNRVPCTAIPLVRNSRLFIVVNWRRTPGRSPNNGIWLGRFVGVRRGRRNPSTAGESLVLSTGMAGADRGHEDPGFEPPAFRPQHARRPAFTGAFGPNYLAKIWKRARVHPCAPQRAQKPGKIRKRARKRRKPLEASGLSRCGATEIGCGARI